MGKINNNNCNHAANEWKNDDGDALSVTRTHSLFKFVHSFFVFMINDGNDDVNYDVSHWKLPY